MTQKNFLTYEFINSVLFRMKAVDTLTLESQNKELFIWKKVCLLEIKDEKLNSFVYDRYTIKSECPDDLIFD